MPKLGEKGSFVLAQEEFDAENGEEKDDDAKGGGDDGVCHALGFIAAEPGATAPEGREGGKEWERECKSENTRGV
jgi:hypothetical protein